MTLGVTRQQPASSGQCAVIADRSECVAEFTIFRGSVAHPIGREQRKIERPCDRDGGTVASFFFSVEMALQLDIHIAAAENSNQSLTLVASSLDAAVLQSGGQRPVRTAGQANESLGMLFQFILLDCPLTFLGAQLHLGDQAAKVLIPG